MDLTLPDMSPELLLHKIRQDSRLTHIPIIAASGKDDIEEVSRRLGCCKILKKPFELASLIRAVKEVLQSPAPPQIEA
jgi:CheY-like chemotaxis protein